MDNIADLVFHHSAPALDMVNGDIDRMLADVAEGRTESTACQGDCSGSLKTRGAVGIRYYLSGQEGTGYHDFFRVSGSLTVFITDVTYKRDTWVTVGGCDFFKIRLLVSGGMCDSNRQPLATGPELSLTVVPGTGLGGYYIAGGQNMRMVVLNCQRALLTQEIGISDNEIPPPMERLFSGETASRVVRLKLSAALMQAGRLLIDSRHRIHTAFRGVYLEAIAFQMLALVLNDCHSLAYQSADKIIASKDVHKVLEARDYIARHFHRPLQVTQLARLVGLNKTKLKTLFRVVLHETICGYLNRCRMERALELLDAGERGIAEVGYAVGYNYPANFTSAFRRQYGVSPRRYRASGDKNAILGGRSSCGDSL
jgi:AraC-like DNA-binding protein